MLLNYEAHTLMADKFKIQDLLPILARNTIPSCFFIELQLYIKHHQIEAKETSSHTVNDDIRYILHTTTYTNLIAFHMYTGWIDYRHI